MSKNNPIVINSLTKIYPLEFGAEKQKVVLNNISITFNEGEVTAISGANGSGKSTLLKIIAGLTKPSSGEVLIKGKIAPIIELGSGFHPDLTGYENIFFYGQILGCKKYEIEKVINEIIAFSEIENYIYEPVKTYSKGMFLRLAYSIVAHLDFDIYLFDEVFAVGDKNFQAKCIDNLLDKKKNGKTILITGHESELIASVSSNIIIIENGKIKDGRDEKASLFSNLQIDNNITLEKFVFFELNENYIFEINVDNILDYECIDVVLQFYFEDSLTNQFIINSLDDPKCIIPITGKSCNLKMMISNRHFNPGKFTVSVFILKNKSIISRTFPNILEFERVIPKQSLLSLHHGPVRLLGNWNID
jgi:ABC-type polysaccharide/polyol phosphate transport system ATPase subunit